MGTSSSSGTWSGSSADEACRLLFVLSPAASYSLRHVAHLRGVQVQLATLWVKTMAAMERQGQPRPHNTRCATHLFPARSCPVQDDAYWQAWERAMDDVMRLLLGTTASGDLYVSDRSAGVLEASHWFLHL